MVDEGGRGSDDSEAGSGLALPSGLIEWAKANAPLLGAGFLGVTVSLQLLGVSQGRLSTAFAILQAGGTGTVATAALSSLLPFVALAGTAFAAYGRFRLRGSRLRNAWSLATGVGVLVCLTIVPVGVLLLSTVVGVVGVVRSRASGDDEAPALALLVVLLAAWVGWAVSAPPWWPLEQVELRSGEEKLAYVVGADAQEVVLLHRGSRLVERVDRDDVVSRRLCSDSASWGLRGSSLLALTGGGGYRRCPDTK